MVKAPCYDKNGLKKGAWSEDEDNKLRTYIQRYGHWNWGLLPKFAGVSRSGKSCRLRWMNYLRPNMKHGNFSKQEDDLVIDLHNKLGNKLVQITFYVKTFTHMHICTADLEKKLVYFIRQNPDRTI
ncbi:putative transcription factor MYB-HB-like family [Helianthus annuus]|nr:putative transcription factor MYB-HB-like family [Helianthus annuus]